MNGRLLYAQFTSKYAKLSVVVAYAPTEEADGEIKDSFYTVLQEVMDEILKHNVVTVAGDLNARIGADNTGHTKVMGSMVKVK